MKPFWVGFWSIFLPFAILINIVCVVAEIVQHDWLLLPWNVLGCGAASYATRVHWSRYRGTLL